MSDRMEWHGTVADFPDLYDILHANQGADVRYYEKACAGCETILECGAGTGRVAIPLARAGFQVHAIDNAPEMLAALAAKRAKEPAEVQERLTIVKGDMRHLAIGREFDVVLIPYMSFNYLGTIEEQLQCLGSIRAHLKAASRLIIELISMYPPWFHNDGVLRLVKRERVPNSGGTIEVFRMTLFDASTQVLEHDRYFRWLDAKGLVLHERRTTLRNRFFFHGEAVLLLERSGFRVTNTWGDHQSGPYSSASQVMLLEAVAV